MSSSTIAVRTLRRLPRSDVAGWNRLAAEAFYSSTRWLDFLAADPAARTGYALVYGDDVLLGGVPVAGGAELANPHYDWDALLAERGLAPRSGGRLVVGPRRGYRANLLAVAGADALAGPLAAGLLAHAQEIGAGGAVALYLDTAGARALRSVAAATVVHLADEATIDLPGSTIDDYLVGLGPHRRNRVAREMREFAAAGYTVTRQPLAETAEIGGPLVGQLQRRHGQAGDDAALSRSLTMQGLLLGDAAETLLIQRSGRAVGFLSFNRHGRTLYLRACGFDYPRLVDAFEYFNVAFYLPAAFAYEFGLDRIHIGIGASRGKVLRGARLSPLWLVDLPVGGAEQVDTADSAAAAWYNTGAQRAVMSQVPARAVDVDDWTPFADAEADESG